MQVISQYINMMHYHCIAEGIANTAKILLSTEIRFMKWKFWKKKDAVVAEPESGNWPRNAPKLLKSEEVKKLAKLAQSSHQLKDAEKAKASLARLIEIINEQALLGRTQAKIAIIDRDYDPSLRVPMYVPKEIKAIFTFSEFGLDHAQKYFSDNLKPLGYQILLRNINWNIQSIHGTNKETFVGYELIIAC
jgi:hypothetical protein